jgi:hypothetical protein
MTMELDGGRVAKADEARLPVFVFGSNLAGRHGKGAALWARQNRGAVYGQGSGLQGHSYAIPTKGYRMEVLPIPVIQEFVHEFLIFAHKYWFREFQLTPIGCGLAGYKREQIEPLFRDAPDNVVWPPEWGSRSPAQSSSSEPL